VTVVARRPGPPLAGLVTEIVYRTGEQSRTSVEKILPGPGTGLWVNPNRDAFRSFGWADTAARHGHCDQAHLADEFRDLADVTPAGYLRSRVNGPNHLRFDVRS
jgi:hypothetical protein